MPGSLWKEKLSLPSTQTSGISDRGRCLHRGGKKGRSERPEWNGQLGESVFRVTNELCVYRKMFSFHIHLGYLPKKHGTDQKEASHQWKKCLFTVKTDFKAPVLNPASSRDLREEDLTKGWPHGQMPLSGCSLCPIKWATVAEGGCAHHTLKKLLKYHWRFLNLISREQKIARN